MARLDPCIGSDSQELLTVDQALDRINSEIHPITGSEIINLRDSLGRIVSQDLRSQIDVPPYRNSAMDGYAFNSREIPVSGFSHLVVVGTSWAGKPIAEPLAPGQCVRIFTGAAVPPEADTVIMQEHTNRNDNKIEIPSSVCPGDNIRHPGEDISKQQKVVCANQRLVPVDLGLLASAGITKIPVWRKLRVAFFSTGDELRSLGNPLEFGTIYDSNRYILNGLLEDFGAEIIDMGVIQDHPDTIKESLRLAASISDVVITTGGASVGEADYLHEALKSVGKINFWKISMKPGKPNLHGTINNSHFFGLPGNPVSVVVSFYKIVLPTLNAISRQKCQPPLRVKARTMSALNKVPGRQEFQRATFHVDTNGEYRVQAFPKQASHILTSFSNANCFIVLPEQCSIVEKGEIVTIEIFGN